MLERAAPLKAMGLEPGSPVLAGSDASDPLAHTLRLLKRYWPTVLVSCLAALGLAFIYLAVTPPLSRRLGKKPAAMAISMAAIAFTPVPIVLRLLGAFPPNGSPLLMPILFTHNTIAITLVIMSGILTSSMVADIVEDAYRAVAPRTLTVRLDTAG